MQCLEVSGAVRLVYRSLGVKGLKNGWQNAVLLWCMLQAGPPSLHYYCAVVLHSWIVLPPVGHSSNHEYHCCQRTRQSNCVPNFYRAFKVFIWLSLVLIQKATTTTSSKFQKHNKRKSYNCSRHVVGTFVLFNVQLQMHDFFLHTS